MKKKWFLIIIFLIILIGIIIFSLPPKVCFNNQCFRVEIAKTPDKRAMGLMFRESLDQNRGMLFIYPQSGDYSFWMKNTYIPLDIIWIDENQEVVFINKNSEPCNGICPTIDPSVQAKYVLEINNGISNAIGLKVGDNLVFKGIKIRNFLVK